MALSSVKDGLDVKEVGAVMVVFGFADEDEAFGAADLSDNDGRKEAYGLGCTRFGCCIGVL